MDEEAYSFYEGLAETRGNSAIQIIQAQLKATGHDGLFKQFSREVRETLEHVEDVLTNQELSSTMPLLKSVNNNLHNFPTSYSTAQAIYTSMDIDNIINNNNAVTKSQFDNPITWVSGLEEALQMEVA